MIEGIYQFNWSRDGEWLKKSVSYIRTEDTCGFVVLDKDAKQVGAAIFDNFLHSSAQITLVIQSPKAIKFGLLPCAENFIFGQMEKKRVFAMVSMNNEKSIRLSERVGFQHVFTISDGAARGVDMLVYQLEKGQLNLESRKKTGALHGVA